MIESWEAIKAVREGYRIQREGWNGKGMYVYQTEFSDHKPCLVLLTATGEKQPGWVFSQADLYADDWSVVGETYVG